MVAPLLAGLGFSFAECISFDQSDASCWSAVSFSAYPVGQYPWLAAFTGTLAGIVTQSTGAVTYVIIGLVSGRVVDNRRAILIPTWAHVGTSVLVILVAINFKVAASYLIALVGFAVYFNFERTDRARHIIGTLFGIALLFLGLDALKSAAASAARPLIGDGIVAQSQESDSCCCCSASGLRSSASPPPLWEHRGGGDERRHLRSAERVLADLW